MEIEPFKPEDFGFILRSDYTPPLAPPAHYERDSQDHKIGPDKDWVRINVFLSKDGDFFCIWYGVLDPVFAKDLCLKQYIPECAESIYDMELFRGNITSNVEAEIILNALRLDQYQTELNLGLLPPDDPSFDNEMITKMVDTRPEVIDLLKAIKRNIETFKILESAANKHWMYEDHFYRFYHQSFKVYALQKRTLKMVEALKLASPNRELNEWFSKIVTEGTGKTFSKDDNKNWVEITRPILEAFLHSKFFVEMAVKYGRELHEPPIRMPDGWAALLYLYNLR